MPTNNIWSLWEQKDSSPKSRIWHPLARCQKFVIYQYRQYFFTLLIILIEIEANINKYITEKYSKTFRFIHSQSVSPFNVLCKLNNVILKHKKVNFFNMC